MSQDQIPPISIDDPPVERVSRSTSGYTFHEMQVGESQSFPYTSTKRSNLVNMTKRLLGTFEVRVVGNRKGTDKTITVTRTT